MVFRLPLPKKYQNEGWKVKILENERVEEPHVTVYHKKTVWRINLRDRTFLDRGGTWKDIHPAVQQEITDNWNTLQREWDEKYPFNPVPCPEEENEQA